MGKRGWDGKEGVDEGGGGGKEGWRRKGVEEGRVGEEEGERVRFKVGGGERGGGGNEG